MSGVLPRIFLLSHMRAYTSLAGHILGSHPCISGYFELHLSYEGPAALDRQQAILEQEGALKPEGRYLFDKLLHNEYRLQPERLGDTGIRLLVSIAEPERTLKSILALFGRKSPHDPYASPEGAFGYYLERLEALARFCDGAAGHFYYDAELFRAAPAVLLVGLSDWLELDPPLSERYQTFPRTGEARWGDSSSNIRSGRILDRGGDYAHVHLPRHLLEQARALYLDCRQRMIESAARTLLLDHVPVTSASRGRG